MNRLLAATLAATALAGNLHDRSHYEAKFYDWLQEHKVDIRNGEHFAHMLQNFANNDDLIEQTNAKKLSYTLGHNAYSHMSNEEFNEYFNLGKGMPARPAPEAIHEAPANLTATAVDWTTKTGVVTPVKNQGNCGSCWSFSATGGLEGRYGQLHPQTSSWTGFSEQNLVSCDTTDSGCNGGWMDNAFTWVQKNGICTEVGYPYTSGTTGINGACQTTCSKVSDLTVTGFTDVTPYSDTALTSALDKGPVSVAIQANQPAFQMYKSGVLTGTCGDNLDHGVLAVGYGTDATAGAYYKVKNSWGTSWGEAGYIRLEKASGLNCNLRGQCAGQCGILAAASYPNVQ